MKYIFSLIIFQLCFLIPVNSQTTAIYLSAGYNIPTTTSVIGIFYTDNSSEINSSTYSQGFLFQGGYQYIINNTFVFDLGVNYLLGLRNEHYHTSYENYSSFSTSNISIAPTVSIKINAGIFSPYTKFGFSVNFISLDTKWETEDIYSNIDKREYSFKSNTTFGIVGGIGLDFLVDQTFIPYIETQLNSIAYYPNEVEVMEYYRDGTKLKVTYQLVDKIDESTSDENIMLTTDFPYSSLSFIIGLRMEF